MKNTEELLVKLEDKLKKEKPINEAWKDLMDTIELCIDKVDCEDISTANAFVFKYWLKDPVLYRGTKVDIVNTKGDVIVTLQLSTEYEIDGIVGFDSEKLFNAFQEKVNQDKNLTTTDVNILDFKVCFLCGEVVKKICQENKNDK